MPLGSVMLPLWENISETTWVERSQSCTGHGDLYDTELRQHEAEDQNFGVAYQSSFKKNHAGDIISHTALT